MMTNAPPETPLDTAEIKLGEDILGIRGPVDIPSGLEWLWWTLGALAALGLLYLLIKNFLSKLRIVRPPRIPYVAPHTLARRRLGDALRLIGDPYRFCTAVSLALREYIEGRFEIHAPDRTTDEFLDELRHDSVLSPDQQDLMAEFLNQCDLVKFAREELPQEELQKLHVFALGLVEETMPGVNNHAVESNKEVAA